MFVLMFIFFVVNLYSGLIEPLFFTSYTELTYIPSNYELEHYNQDLIYFDYLLEENLDPYPALDYQIKPLPWTDPAEPMHGGAIPSKEYWKSKAGGARSHLSELDLVERIMKLNIHDKKTKKMFTAHELNSNKWTKLDEKWMDLWSELNRLDLDTRDTIIIMYIMFKRNGAWDHNMYKVLTLRLKAISNKHYWIFKK